MLEALRSSIHVREVTLAVRDLACVAAFYRDVLGFRPVDAAEDEASLAAADGTVLLRLRRTDAPAETGREPGLFHIAFLLPSRADLAAWIAHAQALGAPIEGASDHLVSEAIYLSDPEGNGIEVYADRPRAGWRKEGDGVAMATLPLDGRGLMAELSAARDPWTFPAEGRIGHVHLRVGDLAEAEAFYRGALGMDVMARYPGAVFLSWGGYHHHLAVNVWRARGSGPRPARLAGLAEITLSGPGPARSVTDPAGLRLRMGGPA